MIHQHGILLKELFMVPWRRWIRFLRYLKGNNAAEMEDKVFHGLIETFTFFWALSLPASYLLKGGICSQGYQHLCPGNQLHRWWSCASYPRPMLSSPTFSSLVFPERSGPRWFPRDHSDHCQMQFLKKPTSILSHRINIKKNNNQFVWN